MCGAALRLLKSLHCGAVEPGKLSANAVCCRIPGRPLPRGTTHVYDSNLKDEKRGMVTSCILCMYVCCSHYAGVSTHLHPAQPVSVPMPPISRESCLRRRALW